MFNTYCMSLFILPKGDDCTLAPEENLVPNSTDLKSSGTRGVWHKSLEENHAAQIKERSLLGHPLCSEETPPRPPPKKKKKNSRIGYFLHSRD